MGYLGRHATYAKTFSLKSLTKWGTAFTFVIYAISLSIAHGLSFRKDLKFIMMCRSLVSCYVSMGNFSVMLLNSINPSEST